MHAILSGHDPWQSGGGVVPKLRLWQDAKETTSGGSTVSATSSGLGSSTPASADTFLQHIEDDDDDEGDELQTEKLVSACNNAVSRLSTPTSGSEDIELDRLAWKGQGQGQGQAPDRVEQPSSPRR